MTTPTKIQLTPGQTAVLGQLLVEILQRNITEETRRLVCELVPNSMMLPSPFQHLVSWIMGSGESNQELTISMMKELLIICDELQKETIP